MAGEIWHFLDKEEEVTFSQLAEGLSRPNELILMSLGWLAREGHVLVRLESNEYKISLR